MWGKTYMSQEELHPTHDHAAVHVRGAGGDLCLEEDFRGGGSPRGGGGFQDTNVPRKKLQLDPPYDHAASGW